MTANSIKTWALAAALWPALALAEAEVEELRAMALDGTVTVINIAGDINISAWDRSEARLKAELGDHQELEITESSNGLRFEVINARGEDRYDEADLELTVPAGASIVVEGVSSDIMIEGSEGDSISAESVSGDVSVEAAVARIDLSSVSGDVDFEGSSTRAAVESVSGDIDLQGVSGEVAISTVSGDVDMHAGSIERGRFETVSGTLKLALSMSEGGKITVESMSGDVKLALPEGQKAEFSAQSFSGDIESAWGVVKNESRGPGSHLKHTEGKSGTLIRVESFSGDIVIGRQ